MTNVSENQSVKTRGDVQNVITSTILRQYEMFSNEDIYEKVEEKLENSDFGKGRGRRQEIDLKKMVGDTLNVLWQIRCINYVYGENKYKIIIDFPSISTI